MLRSSMISLDYVTSRKLYDEVIKPPMNKERAVILGAPIYSNVGDHSILLGAYEYLRQIHREVIVVQNFATFKPTSSDVIYFLGGGNFGDMYPRIHLDKIRRLRAFRGNRIVFLPQSICFRKRQIMKETQNALAGYDGDVTLLVRDEESKRIAEELFDIEVQIAPDSALLLEPKLREWAEGIEPEGCLYIQRSDKESEMRLSLNMPTADLMRAGIAGRPELSVRLVLNLIAARSLIVSDRLHGALLAALIGRHAILLPNAYHKNEAFTKTWSIPGLVFAPTESEVRLRISEILKEPPATRSIKYAVWSSISKRYFRFGYRHLG
jgi:exopolysaccharide biosynthesis predicted pyruvyltransferase EpsI